VSSGEEILLEVLVPEDEKYAWANRDGFLIQNLGNKTSELRLGIVFLECVTRCDEAITVRPAGLRRLAR